MAKIQCSVIFINNYFWFFVLHSIYLLREVLEHQTGLLIFHVALIFFLSSFVLFSFFRTFLAFSRNKRTVVFHLNSYPDYWRNIRPQLSLRILGHRHCHKKIYLQRSLTALLAVDHLLDYSHTFSCHFVYSSNNCAIICY